MKGLIRRVVLACVVLSSAALASEFGPAGSFGPGGGGGSGGGGGVTSYTKATATTAFGLTCEAADNSGTPFYFGITNAASTSDCDLAAGTGSTGAVCYCNAAGSAHAFVAGGTAFRGPVGPTGATGATGPAGSDGTNGTNGTNGATGATGAQGPQGIQGTPGADGSGTMTAATPGAAGSMTAVAQSFGGVKTFVNGTDGYGGIDLSSSGTITLGTNVTTHKNLGYDADGSASVWFKAASLLSWAGEYGAPARVFSIIDANIPASGSWVPWVDASDGLIYGEPADTAATADSIAVRDGSGDLTANEFHGDLENTPAGGISATTTQGAINELDTEKASSSDVIVFSTGTSTPEGNESCVAKPCFYTQTGLVSTSPDNGSTVLWAFNGVNGTSTGWARVNDMKSRAIPVSMALQDCASDVCPNPQGAFVIDTGAFWSSVPGGRKDADGTMYNNPPTVTAVTDFIADSSSYTLASTTTQWAGATNGPSHASGVKNAFCRDSSSPYAACSQTATGTCTGVPGGTATDALMLYHPSTEDYWPLAVNGITQCSTGNQPVFDTPNGPPVATTTNDIVQQAMSDGIHGSTYYHRWLASLFWLASEEGSYWPAVNPLVNGDGATNCGSAGWVKSYTGSIGTLTFSPTTGGTGSAVRGSGCQFTPTNVPAASEFFDTSQFSVVPGRVYVAKGYIRVNSTTMTPIVKIADGTTTLKLSDATLTGIVVASTTATATTAIEHTMKVGDTFSITGTTTDTDLNGSYTVATVPSVTTFTFTVSGAVGALSTPGYVDTTMIVNRTLPTADVSMWHVLGGSNIGSTTSSTPFANETIPAYECYAWCFVVVKFRAGPTQTSAAIRFSASTGTSNVNVDEWTAFPSPTQNMNLNPLIKDGLVNVRLIGDSRSDAPSGTGDFGPALDTMLPLKRPNLAITSPIVNSLYAGGGWTLNTNIIASGAYSGVAGTISDYVIIYFGTNDSRSRTIAQFAGTGSTVATSGDMLKVVRAVRKTGSIPIIIVDSPNAGNISSGSWTTLCGGASANCATTENEYFRTIIDNGYLY